MKLVYLILCFAFASTDQSANSIKESKIAGSTPIWYWAAGYTAALEKINEGYFAVACIISKDWLIGAEHTFFNITNPRAEVWIRIGSPFLETKGFVYNIDDVFRHPNRKPFSLVNDYILIKVSGSIKLNYNIKAISIVAASFTPVKGDELKITGWGIIRGGGKYVKRIRLARILVVTNQNCSKAYKNAFGVQRFPIHESQFCASSEKAAACTGDSGAPAVHNGKLAGIVIYNENTQNLCKTSKYPHILANIAHAYHWIKRVTNIPF